MTITFNTNNKEEVKEIVELLTLIGAIKSDIAVKRTEKGSETPKEVKPIVTPTPEDKNASTASKVTLTDLQKLAKTKATDVGRAEVKTAIAKYAEKLSAVGESDYANLLKDLEAL